MSKRLNYCIHKAINHKAIRINLVNFISLTSYMKQYKYKYNTVDFQQFVGVNFLQLSPWQHIGKQHSMLPNYNKQIKIVLNDLKRTK